MLLFSPKMPDRLTEQLVVQRNLHPGNHIFFPINSIESFYLKVKRSCLLRLEFTSKHFPQTVKRFLRHENIFQGSENFFEQHEIFNFVKKDLLNLKMLCQNFSRKTNILWISFEFKHNIKNKWLWAWQILMDRHSKGKFYPIRHLPAQS